MQQAWNACIHKETDTHTDGRACCAGDSCSCCCVGVCVTEWDHGILQACIHARPPACMRVGESENRCWVS